MDGLSVLKLLDEFHLQHLHLHDLSLFLADEFLLLGNLSSDILSSLHMLLPSKLLDLGSLKLLLLSEHLGFKFLLLLLLHSVHIRPVLMLLANELSLLGLFLLMQNDGILNLLFLHFALLFLLHHSMPILCDSLLLHLLLLEFLLHFHIVLLLKLGDLGCPSLRLLDLLPRFHFFLFQESDPVRQKLGISFDTIEGVNDQHGLLTLFSPWRR